MAHAFRAGGEPVCDKAKKPGSAFEPCESPPLDNVCAVCVNKLLRENGREAARAFTHKQLDALLVPQDGACAAVRPSHLESASTNADSTDTDSAEQSKLGLSGG